MTAELFIGLISGTSRDGIDAVLADLEEGRPEILHATCTPYPSRIRAELERLLQTPGRPQPDSYGLLDRQLGHLFARSSRDLMRECGLEPRDVGGIGSHGQTVWHEPAGSEAVSIQLGQGAVIANITRVVTVTDFRHADIRAGGQGAPLAPLLHANLFRPQTGAVAVLNLGGIANLTWLEANGTIRGFDTGPANCLMDLWCRRHLDRPWDDGGTWAASGKLDDALLARLLDDPFFDRPPPRSTGLEHFNAGWLEGRLGSPAPEPEDVQRTLAELTATTIARSVQALGRPDQLLVCGGGVHNEFLMARLRDLLAGVIIDSTSKLGVDPDWIEACLFAWLARERLQGRKQDTRSITGAREPVLLGDVHTP